MKINLSLQVYKKDSVFKLHKNSSSGSQVVCYRWTDGRTDSRTWRT